VKNFRKKVVDQLKAPIDNPYEEVKRLLWHPWADTDTEEEIIVELQSIIALSTRPIFRGIKSIKILLEHPNDYDLIHLVTCEANQVLDNPLQEAVIKWLEDTLEQILGLLRENGIDLESV